MEEIQEIVPTTIQNVVSTVNLGCKLDLISKLNQNHSKSMEEIQEMVPTIKNLVSTVNLGCKLDRLISKLNENHSKSMEEIQEIIIPTIQNVVSTVNLGCKLDLTAIASHARNAEYNRKRFSAVIMRIREPRTTALIFASGKLVCTGAKSESDSKLAARKYARIVQKLGFPVDFINFKIQNIVGSCDVKFAIKLELLLGFHGEYALYDPEVFPGMIYRMIKPKIVLLIFVSGKIVLTGAKVRQEIYDAFANIFPVLNQFKKKQLK